MTRGASGGRDVDLNSISRVAFRCTADSMADEQLTPEVRALIAEAADERAKNVVQSAYFNILLSIDQKVGKLATDLNTLREDFDEHQEAFIGLCRLILEDAGEEEPSDQELFTDEDE